MASFSPCRRQLRYKLLRLHHLDCPALASSTGVFKVVTLLLFCLLLSGCQPKQNLREPSIQFTRIPHAGEGGPGKLEAIEGRVIGARPGQQIVLFARSGLWWVQPRVDQPYTSIQKNAAWRNVTHLGTNYAAMLVDPGFHPQPTMDILPSEGNGVIALAETKGRPPFWTTWSFMLATAGVTALVVLMLFRLRVHALTHQMNMRFEERLAERARIARELHDSLLQGFQGLMFRLQAVRDLLPSRPGEAIQALDSALDRGDQVIAEGRGTVENLRGYSMVNADIVQALTALGEELGPGKVNSAARLHVFVEGKRRDLDPILRDEIYRIAREAVRNAFNHAQAHKIEALLRYGDSQFLLRVRDDGIGIDPGVFNQGGKAGHWGLVGMSERAKEFGGKVKVWSELGRGTDVELSIPASIAFGGPYAHSRLWFLRRKVSETHEHRS